MLDAAWRRDHDRMTWVNADRRVAVTDEDLRRSPGGLEWTLREAEKITDEARRRYGQYRGYICQ